MDVAALFGPSALSYHTEGLGGCDTQNLFSLSQDTGGSNNYGLHIIANRKYVQNVYIDT